MTTSPPNQPQTGERRRWESQWQRHRGSEFHWYLSEPPSELVRLIDERRPAGGALDLGCGPGVATAFIADSVQPSIGLDIAFAAVSQARELCREKDRRASFLVAEVPALPFRSGSFGLVFDRGCLQVIPRAQWQRYFDEVERLLAPGGLLQLYVSKAERTMPPLLSARGVRLRVKRMRGRTGPQFLTPDVVRGHLPSSMRELELRQFPFHTTEGTVRSVTYGLFEKA